MYSSSLQHTHPCQSKSCAQRAHVLLYQSFIHSRNKYPPKAFYAPDTLLSFGDRVVSDIYHQCILATIMPSLRIWCAFLLLKYSSLVPIFFNLYVKWTAGLWALLKELAHKVPLICLTFILKKNRQNFTQEVKPTIWPM